MRRTTLLLAFALAIFSAGLDAQDLALTGGTILTITRGTIPNGTLVIRDGKIVAVGREIAIPPGVQVIDVTGKYVMPGILDSHSHIALESVNEATDPVTPQIWMEDGLEPESIAILHTLAGGVTTVKTMHGSANVIGGVSLTIKLKSGRPAEEMIVPGARRQLKLALGENPKRVYGQKGRQPSTRMGTAYIMRKAFTEAREYKDAWDRHDKDRAQRRTRSEPPRKDLGLETLKKVLEKELAVDCHAYRAEEIVWIIDFCREFGIDLKQISHCVDGYKVADIMAKTGVSYGGWADWWGFKDELYEACPYGIKIMVEAGVNVVLNSDNPDECRYLNLIAAKVLKYNDLSEDDVLRMITLNSARSMEIDDIVGSLDPGKDGDVAVFDKHPLDSTSKCLLTIIEGRVYFDYAKDSAAVRGGF